MSDDSSEVELAEALTLAQQVAEEILEEARVEASDLLAGGGARSTRRDHAHPDGVASSESAAAAEALARAIGVLDGRLGEELDLARQSVETAMLSLETEVGRLRQRVERHGPNRRSPQDDRHDLQGPHDPPRAPRDGSPSPSGSQPPEPQAPSPDSIAWRARYEGLARETLAGVANVLPVIGGLALVIAVVVIALVLA